MTLVAVAMSEIVREGTWALRALGYPYGTAERAAGLLAWTEAVHRNGLALMRVGEAAIGAGAKRPPPCWSTMGRVRRAEAHAKCLFECGPPMLDLVTADARLNGLGRAVLLGAIGTKLAASLGALAARRGLAAVLVHVAAAAEIAPVPDAGWIVALPTPEGPAFLAGGLDQTPRAIPPELLAVAAEDSAAARASGPGGYFSIAAVPSPATTPPAGVTDWPQRLARAYRLGIAADPADYQALYSLEMRSWAPTSERSRAQAGYGRF